MGERLEFAKELRRMLLPETRALQKQKCQSQQTVPVLVRPHAAPHSARPPTTAFLATLGSESIPLRDGSRARLVSAGGASCSSDFALRAYRICGVRAKRTAVNCWLPHNASERQE